MSTYLLAIAITDFKYLETKNSDGLPIRVYTPPHLIDDGKLALKVTPESLAFFEHRFGIKYKLPKLDVIMLPDFKSGAAAMENWGLVTFSVSSLLYDPEKSTTHALQQVTSVIAHELAHQWFGNLVTMKWWTDLWLNEGFATFADYTALEAMRPEWKMMDQLFVRTQRAYVMDSLETSRPVHAEVGGTKKDINPTFDGISYMKGCALVRMVQDFVSRGANDTIFFDGLRSYLTKHEFSNTVDTDLWNAINTVKQSSASHRDNTNLADVMKTWTHQSGYPIVTFNETGVQNVVTVTQSRFRMAPRAGEAPSGQRWSVPVTYVTRNYPHWRRLHFISESQQSNNITLQAPPAVATLAKDGILIANVGRRGFYRVNYPPKHWNYLGYVLRSTIGYKRPYIQGVDRAALLDDAFELGRAAVLGYERVLSLTQYLSKEKEYVPWLTALVGFSYMRERLSNSRVRVMLGRYVLSLVTPILDDHHSVRLPHRSHELKLRRSLMFSAGWVYDHKPTRKEALRLWNIFKHRPFDFSSTIPADILPTVLHAGIESGGDEDWDFAWSLYNAPRFSFTHTHSIISALATSRSPWNLNRLLDLSLDRTKVRGNDCMSIFYNVARNPIGTQLLWDFFQKHFHDAAMKSLPMSSIISGALSHLDTPKQLEEFEAFFANPKNKANKRAVRQAAELIRANVRWRERNEKTVCGWLTNKKFGDGVAC